ncbi:hypothetical protein HNY73_011885 [Argiope bruennichi]|uniref:Uncharacterized protein n=1 Tax=Argiope bruennichi TaxID=94029 RepID=A0A8T0ET88_ARGBR|nr:hypothetical protein HNY73_011885 [Argiope bruennichi]
MSSRQRACPAVNPSSLVDIRPLPPLNGVTPLLGASFASYGSGWTGTNFLGLRDGGPRCIALLGSVLDLPLWPHLWVLCSLEVCPMSAGGPCPRRVRPVVAALPSTRLLALPSSSRRGYPSLSFLSNLRHMRYQEAEYAQSRMIFKNFCMMLPFLSQKNS